MNHHFLSYIDCKFLARIQHRLNSFELIYPDYRTNYLFVRIFFSVRYIFKKKIRNLKKNSRKYIYINLIVNFVEMKIKKNKWKKNITFHLQSWHDVTRTQRFSPKVLANTILLLYFSRTSATPFSGGVPRKRGWRGWLAWADQADPNSSRMRLDLASLLSHRGDLSASSLKITSFASFDVIDHPNQPLSASSFLFARFTDSMNAQLTRETPAKSRFTQT